MFYYMICRDVETNQYTLLFSRKRHLLTDYYEQEMPQCDTGDGVKITEKESDVFDIAAHATRNNIVICNILAYKVEMAALEHQPDLPPDERRLVFAMPEM